MLPEDKSNKGNKVLLQCGMTQLLSTFDVYKFCSCGKKHFLLHLSGKKEEKVAEQTSHINKKAEGRTCVAKFIVEICQTVEIIGMCTTWQTTTFIVLFMRILQMLASVDYGPHTRWLISARMFMGVCKRVLASFPHLMDLMDERGKFREEISLLWSIVSFCLTVWKSETKRFAKEAHVISTFCN